MASIKDVARAANVGVGTASRALSGNGYVAPETRKKIEDAARTLHYTPSELARNLLRNRSGIIAVVIPCLDHCFYAKFVQLIESKLYDHGYRTLICCTLNQNNAEQDYLDMFRKNLVDGIITATHSFLDEDYQNSCRAIVSFDRDFHDPSIPIVCSDHVKGGTMAAQRFLDNGCKKVLQIYGSGTTDGHTIVNTAHDTFQYVLESHNVEVLNYFTDWNRWDQEYYQEVIRKCIERYPDIDGAFTSDTFALHFLTEAQNRGFHIPEDIKIVSYDGTSLTQMVSPSITAVVQDIDALTTRLIQVLFQLISGKKVEPCYLIDVKWKSGQTA